MLECICLALKVRITRFEVHALCNFSLQFRSHRWERRMHVCVVRKDSGLGQDFQKKTQNSKYIFDLFS